MMPSFIYCTVYNVCKLCTPYIATIAYITRPVQPTHTHTDMNCLFVRLLLLKANHFLTRGMLTDARDIISAGCTNYIDNLAAQANFSISKAVRMMGCVGDEKEEDDWEVDEEEAGVLQPHR